MAPKLAVANTLNDPLPVPGPLPHNLYNAPETNTNMDEYKLTVPLWKRLWQHSPTQMLLLGV